MGQKPGTSGLSFRLNSSAILVVNEFEEKKMKEDNQQREGGPKEGGQSSKSVAVFMKSYDVLHAR